MRSQLPGDSHGELNGCDLFFHRAKSKPGNCVCWENLPSLTEGCFSIVLREAQAKVDGDGEGEGAVGTRG